MTLRFIHTADWQLGKPFRNFPAALAGELAAARLDAVQRIAGLARARGAGHVLVAGDVFDSVDIAGVELRRALQRLNDEADITWLLLPGNHDAARPGGLWDRVRRLGLPGNVVALTAPEPYALNANASVLPAPLTSKNPGSDPTAWMDTATTAPGVARIGLAHGSVRGFGSDGESAVDIAADRARRAGLSYLALGDWHGALRISADTWYSGTPEPDRFPDNEPGYVLSVTLEGASAPQVVRVASNTFTWAKLSVALASKVDLDGIERDFARVLATPRSALVRLTLTGSLSLTEHGDLEAWVETWSGRLRHLEVDQSALHTRTADADLDTLGRDGPLSDVARTLSGIATDEGHPQRAVAETALVRLFGFAAEAAREAAP